MEYDLVPFVLEKVEVLFSGRLSPMVDNSLQVLPKVRNECIVLSKMAS